MAKNNLSHSHEVMWRLYIKPQCIKHDDIRNSCRSSWRKKRSQSHKDKAFLGPGGDSGSIDSIMLTQLDIYLYDDKIKSLYIHLKSNKLKGSREPEEKAKTTKTLKYVTQSSWEGCNYLENVKWRY